MIEQKISEKQRDGKLRLVTAFRSLPLLRRQRGALQGRTVDAEIVERDVDPDRSTDAETYTGVPWRTFSFIALVIVPFIGSAIYYTFIATDQYIAEARFAVRSLESGGTGDNLEGGVLDMRSATQDSYVVTSFIQSSEILRRLQGKIDYRAVFAGGDVDYFSSFSERDSTEEFLEYWRRQVTAYIDGPSGIITLKVRSFRPEDSLKLTQLLIEESEILINELSQRARADLLGHVKEEVESTATGYGRALNALNAFQKQSGLLSPQTQVQETGKLLTGLLAKKLEIETRQFVVKQSDAEKSPAYEQLQLTRASLDAQIEELKAKLTGDNADSIAGALVKYSELETNRLVAEKLYEVSRKAYDAALSESLRKALYLVVFVKPSLPEKALFPYRVFSPFMTFIGLAVCWCTLALGWASVQDHRL